MSDEAAGKSTGASPIEGVNKTVVAVVVALLGAGGIALAYFFNWVSDQLVGLFVAGAFATVLAVLVVRVALDLVQPGLRYGAFALVLGMACVALYPASVALHLGRPSASATLDEGNSTLALPSGGHYQVLVSGHLGESRDARITYRLKAGEEVVDGALERAYMTRRARRGAAIQVPEDHDLAAHEIAVPDASPSLTLETGTKAAMLVQAFHILPPALVWALMLLVALAGMFLESRAPSNGTLVMSAVAAGCFGLIIKTATPSSMAWATLWGALLAAGGGAVGGSILAAIGKKVFPAPEAAGPKGKQRRTAGSRSSDSDDESEGSERASG
ncbi:MAG: hypothetical protein HY901_02410 [Deltaproteobacteria bacterium]|nr:hypothetical protein [Deltaproteobacteria bacterium]